MKQAVLHIGLLVALQVLWVAPAHSQGTGSSKLIEEMLKQEKIYQGDGEQAVEGYTVDRSLADYAKALVPGFDVALAKLGASDRWLDIGAGTGRAILDYFSGEYDLTRPGGGAHRAERAAAVAMSIEDRRPPAWLRSAADRHASKMNYLFGRHFRQYSSDELGRFRLITDVIGGFSYTDALALFVEKVLGILELNGSFYTLLADVQAEDGRNLPYYSGSPYLTEIKQADGTDVRVCAWLKSISCVEVSCQLKVNWRPPIEPYHVRKVCNDVKVPALVPLEYTAGTPPERRFELKN